MLKFEKYLTELLAQLPATPAVRVPLPDYDRYSASAELRFPVHCQREPVLIVRYARKRFSGDFYVLNHRFSGYYGITPNDPVASEFRETGNAFTPEFIEHIRKALNWTYRQTGNLAEIPEERKRDAMEEILSALSPEALCRDYTRRCEEGGNRSQTVQFARHWDWEAELNVGYACHHQCWLVDFEICRCNSDGWKLLDTDFDEDHKCFALLGFYSDSTKAQIISHIDNALRWMYALKNPGWIEPFPAGRIAKHTVIRETPHAQD